MDTNLELADAYYLWDFYKDKGLYTFESLFLDHDYVYSPPMEEYGGAWVIVPIGGTYYNFQEDFENTLYGRVQEMTETGADSVVEE